MDLKIFPIMESDKFIPYLLVKAHEAQAYKNHDQSVDTLALRGGLAYEELYAILRDECFNKNISKDVAENYVSAKIEEFNKRLLDGSIKAKELGLRPCMVTTRNRRREIETRMAVFHKWGDGYRIQYKDIHMISAGQEKVKCVIGIVEYSDGSIDEITDIRSIQFIEC